MDEDYNPPYTVVSMPLNAAGQGPEMLPWRVVKTVWQVWDATNRTVSEHPTYREALEASRELMREWFASEEFDATELQDDYDFYR